MRAVVFDAEARAEFDAAAAHYEEQRAGLGDDFVAEVEQAAARIARIARMPRMFPPHGTAGLRKCVPRRFPYNVFFLALDDLIWMAAVAHHRQRPGYWAHRRPD